MARFALAEFGLERDNHASRKRGGEGRAADMEQIAGLESMIGWVRRTCGDEIKAADSWQALHATMAANEKEARMLTILALCHSYDICDDEFLLSHFDKAKAVAEMAAVSHSLTSIDLSSNNLAGETDLLGADQVKGTSFEVGDKVTYEGREMIVSEDMKHQGILFIKMIDLSGVKVTAAQARRIAPLPTVRIASAEVGTMAPRMPTWPLFPSTQHPLGLGGCGRRT